MKTSLLALSLAVFSALTFAQGSQEPPKPAPKARFDCSQTKDPKACEERRAAMRAAHDKAAKACEGKQGIERRECMRHEMCAQMKDPKACEERTAKAKAELANARKACEGKPQGQERRDCVRQELNRK